MNQSLAGEWKVVLDDESIHKMILPGTLDENEIGYKDIVKNQLHPDSELGNQRLENCDGFIATRFTRKYTYEGSAAISREIELKGSRQSRYFINVERARCLKLFVDGNEIKHFKPETISTPHLFEITSYVDGGSHFIQFISDNSYPQLPHNAIVDSSAATDETQTNWNGLIGKLEIIKKPQTFISNIRVLPKGDMLNVAVELSSMESWDGTISFDSEVIEGLTLKAQTKKGEQEFIFSDIPLKETLKKWDEYEGNLYRMSVSLSNGESKDVTFGVRDFTNLDGRLALNGRKIFLRSEANCAEFPETGHLPMDKESWVSILNTYKAYGINCVRFHSHCPSEAAFSAADELGILMQPELSNWNPVDAFEQEESFQYYKKELLEIIKTYANHPSFVMLTFGNELQVHELGMDRMHDMISSAHAIDDTRMYACASNAFYGHEGFDYESDFFTSQSYYNDDLRGTFASHDNKGIKGYINNKYPSTMNDYSQGMNHLRMKYKKPVFSFEVGQFEILPDFDELNKFKGVSLPNNYKIIQDKVKKCGLMDCWKDYVEATGEISNLCYREEIEAAMRTERMSGISLLGLQDFPGQGTALVGMLDSHLEPKPFAFASAERFSSFFKESSILVKMPKYTYENTETYKAEVIIANFSKKIKSGELTFKLIANGQTVSSGSLGKVEASVGNYTHAGEIVILLAAVHSATRADLMVELDGITNQYPLWIYPVVVPSCPDDIYETYEWDEKAINVLKNGGKVYLSPKSIKESFVNSIQAQFSTDFWSVGTFKCQEGGMGQLINRKHDMFKDFPTEKYTNWQWWIMASQRAIILPRKMDSIITEMDSYAYMRPMSQLLEANCLNGRLILSSLGLQDLQEYPEARALLNSIYGYMSSDKFRPVQTISVDEIEKMVVKSK